MTKLSDPRSVERAFPMTAGGHSLASSDRLRDKSAEAEIEKRVRDFANSVPVLVFRCSGSGAWLWAGAQWTQFTGLEVNASLGLGWTAAIEQADRSVAVQAWDSALISGQYSVQQRVWCNTRNAYRWHSTIATRVPGTDEWTGAMTDIHDLLQQSKRQDVVIAELQHRARNLLAVAWAIADKTVKKSDSLAGFTKEFRKRIGALSRVHMLTWREDQKNVDLRELLDMELNAHAPGCVETGKITMEGPAIALSALSAQALGLAIHELSTNAIKYGAFSQVGGRLDIQWSIDWASEPTVRLVWQERGVLIPPEVVSRRCGYGTELIERALPFELGAKTELLFEPDGLCCTIDVPHRKLSASNGRTQ